jgi:hypothetical protein
MAIKILPFEERWLEGVEEMNRRIAAGGSELGFDVVHQMDWLQKPRGRRVWREFWVAVEDDAVVRGGFALKPQEWLIRGQTRIVTDWQGPFSDAAHDPRYAAMGLRLVREMIKLQPLLYSWGHGGANEPIVVMLRKMGMLMHETPFCLRICRPFRFLRKNGQLRTARGRRLLLDLLAWTGLGWLGLRTLVATLSLRRGRRNNATAEVVDSFGPWADELWERCKGDYLAIAVRDSDSMNALIPRAGWPPAIRLKVSDGGRVIGWAAVMDTAMRGDRRFGDLRVGSVVDCLARPADAVAVIAAAWTFLRDRGVDLVVSNQTHQAWIDGFAWNGFVVLPRRRIFAASTQLAAMLAPIEQTGPGMHLTNMDGHGPMAL